MRLPFRIPTLLHSPERLTVFAAGSIQQTIALVKSGVLYSDQVDLVSLDLGYLANLSDSAIRGHSATSPPAPRRIKLRKPDRPFSPRATKDRLGDTPSWGLSELETAAEAKALRLVPIDWGPTPPTTASIVEGDGIPREALLAWADLLLESLTAPDGVLFAPQFAALLEENEPPWAEDTRFLNRVAHGHLGTGLIRKLPSFPQAPMDELLDLRLDLSAPLLRYRTAVRAASASSLIRFSQADATDLTESVWHEKVVPSVAEIQDLYTQHSLVRELARAAGQDIDKFLLYSGGLYVGLDKLSTLNDWAALVLSALPRTSKAIVDAVRQRRDGLREVSQGGFFYLYEVERRLRP